MKRISYFDMAKALLIFSVVLGHFADQCVKQSDLCRSLFIFLYGFHMPAFLFVSGMFHKNEKILKRAGSFLVLYVLLKGLIFAAKWAVYAKASFDLFSEGGTPWFMLAMAVYTILTYCLRKKNLKCILALWLVAALAGGYCDKIGEWMALSRLLVFYPFYLFGYMTKREKVVAAASKVTLKLLACVLLLVWFYICFWHIDAIYFMRHLFTGSVPYHQSVMPYGFLYRLLVYVIWFLTGFSVLMLVPTTKKSVMLTKIGNYTLPVYFFHRPFLYILTGLGVHQILINHFGNIGIYVWLLLAIITVFLFAKSFFDRLLRLFL